MSFFRWLKELVTAKGQPEESAVKRQAFDGAARQSRAAAPRKSEWKPSPKGKAASGIEIESDGRTAHLISSNGSRLGRSGVVHLNFYAIPSGGYAVATVSMDGGKAHRLTLVEAGGFKLVVDADNPWQDSGCETIVTRVGQALADAAPRATLRFHRDDFDVLARMAIAAEGGGVYLDVRNKSLDAARTKRAEEESAAQDDQGVQVNWQEPTPTPFSVDPGPAAPLEQPFQGGGGSSGGAGASGGWTQDAPAAAPSVAETAASLPSAETRYDPPPEAPKSDPAPSYSAPDPSSSYSAPDSAPSVSSFDS